MKLCTYRKLKVLYPHMRNFPYGHRRTQTGIPVCERAGIAKKFAYGDPHTHNEIVRIWGLTYVGYKTEKFTLPVLPLTVLVRVTVLVR